jgi:hypothetical protein
LGRDQATTLVNHSFEFEQLGKAIDDVPSRLQLASARSVAQPFFPMTCLNSLSFGSLMLLPTESHDSLDHTQYAIAA